jgi:hypothetical protein
MMMPKLRPSAAVKGVVLAVIIGGAGIAAMTMQPKLSGMMPKQNLFGIAASMQTTTGNMLSNTKALQTKVDGVNDDLGQLAQQEQILGQQEQTGEQLSGALARQQQLTSHGVALMKNILSREKKTAQLTDTVSKRTTGLASSAVQSEGALGGLANGITVTNQESVHLNSQMDALLSALDESIQEFKSFGQVDRLLSKLGLGGLLPTVGKDASTGVSKTLSSVGGAVGNTVGNAVGGTLGNLTGGLLGHH